MQSLAVTAVATIRMHTSLFRGRGSGTVLIWSTSGGPYAVQTAAFISFPAIVPKPSQTCDPGMAHRGVVQACTKVHPAFQNKNLLIFLNSRPIAVTSRYAKVRREGYAWAARAAE